MKRFFLSITLCACTLFSFSQSLKILDLSNGGCHIDSITVEKIGTEFIIIPEEDSVSISQIIINASERKPLIVSCTTSNDTIFKKEAKAYTDIKYKDQNNKIALPIFSIQVGKNYIVEHNGKQWSIKIRKDGSLTALAKINNGRAIYLKNQNMLCIGDSIVSYNGGDTLHYALTDSFVVSDIDRLLHLNHGGKELEDMFVTDTDDEFFYSTKRIVSADSVFHVGDILTIEKDGKTICVVAFNAKGSSGCPMWQKILIAFIIVAIVAFAYLWLIRKRKKYGEKNIGKEFKDDGKKDSGKEDDITNSPRLPVSEFYSRLNDMIEGLLKNMPDKVNGISKNKFFPKRDDLEDIINYITLVNASNKKRLVKKCTEILAFIETNKPESSEHQSQITDSAVTTEVSKEESKVNIESTGENIALVMSPVEKYEKDPTESPEEIPKEYPTEGVHVSLENQGGEDVDGTINTEIEELREKYKTLQSDYKKLAEDYKEQIEVYTRDIEEAKAETRRLVETEMKAKVEGAQRQANEAEAKRKEAEDSKKEAIETAVRKEKVAQEKEMSRLKDAKRKSDERAEAAENSKKKAVEDAVKKEKDTHEKEEKRLNGVIEKQKGELSRAESSLKSTQNELKETKDDRDKKKDKIDQLEKAQEQFTRSLTSVPFATSYSKQIYDLLNLGQQIQTSAYAVLNFDVDDPYFIMKAISRFGKMMDDIDVSKFLTDVTMVAKANFIFKDSSLATFKGDNKDIDNIVRSYFFNQYLEKYVNALMILNESMAGLKLLLPELQPQIVKFEKFRTELLVLAKKLNITVLYVKVGDMAGENVDLKAKPVDVEIGKPGQILEVENCIVYLTDSRKPQTKIKVTIKK